MWFTKSPAVLRPTFLVLPLCTPLSVPQNVIRIIPGYESEVGALRRDLESTFARNVDSHGSDTRSNLTTTEVVSTRSKEPRGAGVQRAFSSFAFVRTPKRFGLLRATAAAADHARPPTLPPSLSLSLCSAMDGCRDIVRAHSERLFLPRPRATPSFLPRRWNEGLRRRRDLLSSSGGESGNHVMILKCEIKC